MLEETHRFISPLILPRLLLFSSLLLKLQFLRVAACFRFFFGLLLLRFLGYFDIATRLFFSVRILLIFTGIGFPKSTLQKHLLKADHPFLGLIVFGFLFLQLVLFFKLLSIGRCNEFFWFFLKTFISQILLYFYSFYVIKCRSLLYLSNFFLLFQFVDILRSQLQIILLNNLLNFLLAWFEDGIIVD